MTRIRRHLRAWATASLVVQLGWVSALVPRDCCAAHQPGTSAAEHGCHEPSAAAPCPMPSADGTPCPMHRRQVQAAEHNHGSMETSTQTKTNECAMRGSCDGPMAALVTLLSNHGILPQPAIADSIAEQTLVFAPPRASIVCRLESPDPPPPRA